MLRRVLGQTGIEVSVLGFGCAKLTATPQDEALRILETAYAEGITHFDIARLYGLGWAEKILGEFLKGKRDRVTVATKFGLQPPGGWVKRKRLVYAAKKVLGIFPPLVKLARRRAHQGIQAGKFSPEEAIKSLQTSLRELGTDHVEMLLLHEAELADAQSEPLTRALESEIARGAIRCVGIGSDFARLPLDLGKYPPIFKVIQFNHNAQTENLQRLSGVEGRALSTHTVFGPATALVDAVARMPQQEAKQSAARIGVERLDSPTINSLLLHYNLTTNSQGMVLFSSIKTAHVTANAKEAGRSPYDAGQIAKFAQFVHATLDAQPAENRRPNEALIGH